MKITRRDLLMNIPFAATALACPLHWALAQKNSPSLITKAIPSSGQKIPVIGMGTWITFNVGNNTELRDHRTKVLQAFFKGGGQVIDSSPMYGSSEAVLGYALEKLNHPANLFAATKIWTSSTSEGPEQFQDSQKLWGVQTFALEQIHNLVNWRDHLKYLRQLKESGKIKYLGITTSHGRRHDDLLQIIRTEPLDFVQLTYNLTHRQVEGPLLDTAREKGIAVIANRPLDGGTLIDKVQRHPLPAWAPEVHVKNWPEFLLKYAVSHPAITCAIPATSQIEHMRENMGACRGQLPDAKMRARMHAHVMSL